MAETDWTLLNDGLDAAAVDRGVTTGIARPSGGGSFVFGFNYPFLKRRYEQIELQRMSAMDA